MFVADLHNDVLQRAIVGEDIITKSNNGHTDIERLIEGKINLEVLQFGCLNTISNMRHFLGQMN